MVAARNRKQLGRLREAELQHWAQHQVGGQAQAGLPAPVLTRASAPSTLRPATAPGSAGRARARAPQSGAL